MKEAAGKLLGDKKTPRPGSTRSSGFSRCSASKQIKRGAHRSTKELEAAIAAYIDARNADPKPFRWSKTAEDILASIEGFCCRTLAVQAQCG